MDFLPGLRTESPIAANHRRNRGMRPPSVLSNVPERINPEYR